MRRTMRSNKLKEATSLISTQTSDAKCNNVHFKCKTFDAKSNAKLKLMQNVTAQNVTYSNNKLHFALLFTVAFLYRTICNQRD